MNKPTENNTIKEARQWVDQNKSTKPITCPCCDNSLKVYERKITSQMARALIEIYNHTAISDTFIHVPSMMIEKGLNPVDADVSRIALWLLIESRRNTDPTKKDSGYYRITKWGKAFVKGDLSIFHKCYTYNGKRIGWNTSKKVTIFDCLGDKFDYQELIKH